MFLYGIESRISEDKWFLCMSLFASDYFNNQNKWKHESLKLNLKKKIYKDYIKYE